MKNFKVLILSIFLFLGCSIVSPTKQDTKNQDKLNKSAISLDTTQKQISIADKDKITQTAIFASGIKHSLNQVTNSSLPVETALKLNDRIISIVGSPDLDELKKMTLIVDLMNSVISDEKLKGEKLLNKKDSDIISLQKEYNELKDKYDSQVVNLTENAKKIARNADEKQTTLNDMSGLWGLNAVVWGFKKFVTNSVISIVVFLVIFIILRVLSTMNPIAAAAFSIFNVIGSAFMSLIKGLTPKAAELSNLVNYKEHYKYKTTLIKIVDVVEELKRNAKIKNSDYTLSEVLKELDRVMDKEDKDFVDEILKNEKWS